MKRNKRIQRVVVSIYVYRGYAGSVDGIVVMMWLRSEQVLL